jgi:glycosyltransferase involved in cell wall biosynthesis
VKVLEAMAHGVPVVTTPAGVEGIFASGGSVVAPAPGFAAALSALLADPGRRAQVGAEGRAAFLEAHAPAAAARRRVAACRAAFPDAG